MRRKIGKVRQKLAELVAECLRAKGLVLVPFDGDALIPVSGYWKSTDVYRWESVGIFVIVNGKRVPVCVASWDSMTNCVRNGIVLTKRDNWLSFEADRKDC